MQPKRGHLRELWAIQALNYYSETRRKPEVQAMPKQVVLSRVPVELSIVEFNLDAGEEIFLTYTWERREGPDIRRTGQGPPYMDLIGGQPGQTTTHPFGLRLGTWLIQEDMRQDELKESHAELEKARQRRAPQEDLDVLQRTVNELQSVHAHDEVFKQFYPGYEIIGQQGCGDLTMNAWNVAYINSDLGCDPNSGERPPVLVCLPQEPLEYRTYSCLVKWKASQGGVGRVTIEEVKFHRKRQVRDPNEMVWVRFGDRWLPRGDLIEFAVSNQQVIRNGELVPIVTTCHQFGDLRHLIRMPNLNPDGLLYPGEPPKSGVYYRPREYFGKDQWGDIWLGEAAFLQDKTGNLLRAALSGPVFLEFPPGANTQRLRGAMELAGYREVTSALEPLMPGNWRFICRTPQETVLEIYFKRNPYAWTMIGLSPDNRRILCLACMGKEEGLGYTLEQAAEVLLQAGVWNALLIDEGADVFQKVRWGDDKTLTNMMSRQLRRRVRATFIFARRAQVKNVKKEEEHEPT